MTAVLEVDSVSKTFTRTQALAGVSMTIEPGEVHALLGQNGSGKSTLIKILSGYHAPDPGGGIRIQGNELPFQAPVQSYRLGCRFVQQDLGLVPTLSVEDNMSLGSGFPTALGTIRDRASRAQARADLAKLEPRHRPEGDGLQPRRFGADRRRHRPRAARGPRVPGRPARPRRADRDAARRRGGPPARSRQPRSRPRGVGVLYVTHHLGEVFRVAKKVSVFRDGKVVGAGPVADFDHASIVHLLAGEELLAEESGDPAPEGRACGGPQARDGVRDRRSPRRGGGRHLAGGRARRDRRDRGAGRLRPRHRARRGLRLAAARRAARSRWRASRCPSSRPDVAIGQGVAYVAPDRKTGGGVMTMSARENLTLPDLKPFWKGGIVRRKAEKARTKEWFERLSVRPANAIGGAAQHLQRRQPAEDPVREMAVAEADRLPAGRADPGGRRRRQGRPPS